MEKLTRQDLLSLEHYAEQRQDFRRRVMAHKKNRQLALGDYARLYFEDRLTIQYQIQEMLRIEKTFEATGIAEELAAYNPLIPDGDNWKATFMLEYPDPAQRQKELSQLIGIERCVWVQVADGDPVYAIADEDLDRENEEKTSSVHFLRFQLTETMIDGLKNAAELYIGIEHANYPIVGQKLADPIRQSLLADLN